MPHQTTRGVIRYTSNQKERKGQQRGREYFSITRQEDGTRIMHAHCEIDDAPEVLRDVFLVMDAERRPRECTVRISVGGVHEGTGWMRFRDQTAECVTHKGDGQVLRQELPLQEAIPWLGAHPLCGDALSLYCYDLKRGPGSIFCPNMMVTSPDHRGATGPELFPLGFGIEFVGEERLKVAAGKFDALHFRFTETAGQLPTEHPPYDIWCTADGEYLFLKGVVGGYMQTAYELVECAR